ncbi:hypothetical protein PR202_gb23885 [Eleusine coracana subsp. coracana]|uniref:Glycosyltransferase n=1 Tax=Eleusine coracana subsp. coracana TaxID=191504 RepID=A0AAV5FJD1_ELECO|nr:hypothetical protein PR202_gb23885 [Eleusine coracana subsp. coracana]
MGNRAVVLYTWLVRGHFHPMVLFADRLAGYGVPVTLAIADVPSSSSSSSTVARLSSSYPSVSFHLLPVATARSGDEADPDADPFITLIADLRATTPHLVDFLKSILSVMAVVVDFFWGCALDSVADLGLPAYMFFTSGASALAAYLHIPVMASNVSFGDMGRSLLHLPGVHPAVPATDLPQVLLAHHDNEQYKATIGLFEQIVRAKRVLANTYERLEPAAVKAMRDGSPRPGELVPRLFCVGPLVGDERGGERGTHEFLMTWLDAQAPRSVVFLCFGSASSVPAEQLREIAVGLERSGHAFLWAVRAPVAPGADSTKRFEGRDEAAALEDLLPDGFLARTCGRELVVSTWAPQVEVLRHAAIGTFVTHCGWNSILEAITAGVPMVYCPMYAEQRLNKVLVAEGMRLGVVMQGYDERRG